QNLGSVYTKRFNAAHDVSGHLFAGRYKAWLLDKERFLAEATRAIHLQPSRSGLRDKPWRYPWSSCSAYVESEAGEPLIDSQPVLALFASGRLKQSVRYMQYLKDRLKSSSAVLLPVARGQVIGGEEFLARMRARAGRVEPARPSPEAERQVLAEVAKRHGLEPEELTGPGRRRRVAAARREAAYRLSKELRLGVAELGRLFHRTPSALCQALRTAEISTKKLNS
ncbi:MAG: hypothetical protein KGK30_07685, partial [Elusimicrobia bacterium]|nr:hypothetical protein [Elusimicrobiota bacterium]